MILLSNETVDLLLKINGLLNLDDESYNSKILKLKNAGLLNNDEFYGKDTEANNIEKKNCDCSDNNTVQKSNGDNMNIEEFLIDGTYKRTGVGYPNCVYPNGPTYEGTFTIFSIYECDDNTKPFLQKNIYGQTQAINKTRVTSFSFNILNDALLSNSLGSALSGHYLIDGDKLYANYDMGFHSTYGRIAKYQYVFQKIPDGYMITVNIFNTNENRYEIASISRLNRLLQ